MPEDVTLAPINGPDDYVGRHGAEKFFELIDAAIPAHAHRPVILTTHMDLAEGTAHALDALVAANDPPRLFLLGDSPVRIERHPNDGHPLTRELTESRVVYHLAESLEWRKVTKDGQTQSALPSVAVARNILASPELPFPPLERIVEVPVFARDGHLCATPGYDTAARIIYQPPDGLDVPPIPTAPTDDDLAEARALICDDLIGDFPFIGDAERAHAVALFLLPFARDLIDGPTPLHLIEKPTAGTGGSLLADMLLRPACGRALPAMTAGNDADEWRKRITATLSESPIAVLLDNVRRLDSDDLAAALTATTWKDRPLGVSRTVELPVRCVWIATANNPILNCEAVRRTVRIRLDAGIDRPWTRDGFRHPDLPSWTTAHRPQLIAAALTLIQAWVARNRPTALHARLGTYEAWSAVLGGILATAKIPGFLNNLVAFYDEVADDETQAWYALVRAWWVLYHDEPVGVQKIWMLTQGERGIDLDLGDKNEKSQRTRLGKMLGRMRDRIFDEYRVLHAKPVHGAQQWRLRKVAESQPPTGDKEEMLA